MLERKPPTWTSILSSTTSFSVLRRPTSGLDSSSAIDQLERPAVDAARLVDAVDRHLQADQRGLAAERAPRRTAAAASRSCRAWPGRRPPATAPAPAWWRRARRPSRPSRRPATRDLAAVPEVLRPLFFFPLLSHRESSLWISLVAIGTRGMHLPMQTRTANLEKLPARRQHGRDARNRESGDRTPMPDGTTRHRQIPPLPALGGLFLVISKRDPEPSFNRNFHIDENQLTWSYACLRIWQTCVEGRRRQC